MSSAFPSSKPSRVRDWLRETQRRAEALLDLAFPEPCAACAAVVTTAGELLCKDCAALSQTPSVTGTAPTYPTRAPFAYHGPIRDLVHRFKFDDQPHLARRMARSMLPLVCEFAPYPNLTLVPVPLHSLRLASRGYNQSALLAAALAFRANVGYAPRTLTRISEGPKQAQLSRSERQALNAERFRLEQTPAQPVLLIDDVLTTGSTARACIEALQRCNVQVAGVLTFAQVDKTPSEQSVA